MFRLLFAPIRWLLKILLLLLLIGVGLLYAAMFFAGGLLEKELHKKTEFPVEVGSLEVSLLRTRMNLLDLEIRNPTRYPVSDFLKVSRFSADVKPSSLFRSRRVYNEVLLHIDDLALVENLDEEVNIDEFMKRMGGTPSLLARNTAPGEVKEDFGFVLEKLQIRIDRFRTIQSGLVDNESQTVATHFVRTFTDIDDLTQLLPELSSELGETGAQVVVYLLAESLYGVEKMIGGARSLGDQVSEKGEYLWEAGGEAVGNLKNFIEEQRK